MADKIPLRGGFNGGSLTGLAQFASGDTLGVAHGGTGIATIGSNQLVTGNGTSAITSESDLTFDGSTLATTAFTATGNVSLDGGSFVFNESGADKDFRVEGDSNANLLMVDASTDRIGIGTATPSHLLDVEGVAHIATCIVTPKLCIPTAGFSSGYVLPAADGSAGEILCTDGSGAIAFAEAASSGHTIAEEGSVLASRTCLNFVGTAVTATDNSGANATDVTVCATNALLGIRAADGTACCITLSSAAIGECLQSDSSPKLGGNLDVNSNSIISASNGNIPIMPNGTGKVGIGTATPSHLVDIEGVGHAATCFVSADLCATTKVVSPGLCVGSQYALPAADGSAGQLMCTDGSGSLAFATAPSSGISFNGSTANGVATYSSSTVADVESMLTFDSPVLTIGASATAELRLKGHGTNDVKGISIYSGGDFPVQEQYTLGLNWSGGTIEYDALNTFDHAFQIAGTTELIITSGGKVGIGTATPDSTLHVFTASAGAASPASNADDLVVENSAAGGISILTPDANDGILKFGSPTLDYNGSISVNHNSASPYMDFNVNSAARMRITSDGHLGVGTSVPSTSKEATFYSECTTAFDPDADVASGIMIKNGGADTTGQFTGILFEVGSGGGNGMARIDAIHCGTGSCTDLAFSTRATDGSVYEAMRISGLGGVGIGNFTACGRSLFNHASKFLVSFSNGDPMGYAAAQLMNLVNFNCTASAVTALAFIGTGCDGTTNDRGPAIAVEHVCNASSNRDHGNIAFHPDYNTAAALRICTNKDVFIPYNLCITGSISKAGGSFRIEHPLESKKDTHHCLVHSFIEAPQADLVYSGTTQLSDGTATVNVDTEAGMTEGTFILLNRCVRVFTSNETNWDAVRGNITDNVLTIESNVTDSTACVSWMVIGERHDKYMYDATWTDDEGRVVVEPQASDDDLPPGETLE